MTVAVWGVVLSYSSFRVCNSVALSLLSGAGASTAIQVAYGNGAGAILLDAEKGEQVMQDILNSEKTLFFGVFFRFYSGLYYQFR